MDAIRKKRPEAQGLYDPWYEHDSCGVGFVAHIKGHRSNGIVCQALEILTNIQHRGATGAEPNTGDGAGIILQLPHNFFKAHSTEDKITLPGEKEYGVGMVFMPPSSAARKQCESIFEAVIQEEGQTLLGWRSVPTDNVSLGEGSKGCQPVIQQIFIGRSSDLYDDAAFERKLFVVRKVVENRVRESQIPDKHYFYIPSLSYKTIIYKGMLTCNQLEEFYPDLQDEAMDSALGIVHSRFSTNTFPSWDRAHPYRYMAHNGEINTLRGNVNWMHAREALLESDLFGEDIKKICPIIDPNGSDSGMFDNVLEFLSLAGRSLSHVMMMMIPEPWSKHQTMSPKKKAFYEYHSCLMEPWDGPASIAFTDGEQIGAVLDRNGLRPSRYYVTKDERVIMASEVGVLEVSPEQVESKGRLQPGRMFLIDTKEGRIIDDEELKNGIVSQRPYDLWLKENLMPLNKLADAPYVPEPDHETVLRRQQAFGYSFEDLKVMIAPMALDSVDPVGSMGTDTPLAVLSNKPRLLYDYFKQLFAQVTNPPIDAIREEIVTATETTIGAERNILRAEPESCRHIILKSPLLNNEEMARLTHLNQSDFKSTTLPILFPVAQGGDGLEKALNELFVQTDQAIENGSNIIILSDRGISKERAAIPALLAIGGLHHYLIRNGLRTRVSLILESGEPREVHHFCALLGYGAEAINPYLAFESLDDLIRQGLLRDMTRKEAVMHYLKGAMKGMVKVLSKVGISTIQSYRGAQIFEALGLSQALVDRYFTWTATRIGGIDLEILAEEVRMRHHEAYAERGGDHRSLDPGGDHQWRKDGEFHLFNPTTVHKLQNACRTGDYEAFKDYACGVDEQEKNWCTLRGLLEFKDGNPIPLDQVESVEDVCRRFKTGAMSYGSISQEAHESLAIAMNRIGGKSNTGEGGEDPNRFTEDANGDLRRSAIKQVASGRFGVTSEYLTNADEIQIKMAQGAKPGEGGQLPGSKVYPWIAKVRFSTPGVGLISPPPHHDIYSIEDLAELIHDLKNANPQARINVKLVSEVGVGTIAAGVAKAHADVILISGHDGGTGASPRTSIKNAGLPWELGLAETHQTLVLNNLRSRVVLETDGQMKTGRDVAIAAMLGAEEYGFSTAPLVTLGCIMMRVCHLNTCPVGVATQNPDLRKKFSGDPAHVVNFMQMIARQLREVMASLGFRTVNEMIGRTDKLKMRDGVDHWKAKTVDLEKILFRPKESDEVGVYAQIAQNHSLEKSLDRQMLLDLCEPALEKKEPVELSLPIRNIHRVVGTTLGHELTKRHGADALPEDTIKLRFEGSAGQSFGAFVPKGVRMTLEGDANDYIGKGLSGGKIIVYPAKESSFVAEENVVIGNVAFYGATGGESYIRGMSGERFCVRNSGVKAVVEGVGDHACEYMTGGCVVILGPTGRNFAAGMSGGVAYVFDEEGDFDGRCNPDMVALESVEGEDLETLKNLITTHYEVTESTVAKRILDEWATAVKKFVKVMPRDYKRMLVAMKKMEDAGMSGDEAVMAAFEENIKDEARVAGN